VTTADTYTSVLPEVQRESADATAHLVLTAARRTRKKIKNKARKNRPDQRPKTGGPTPTNSCPSLEDAGHGAETRRGLTIDGGTHTAPT
jgi:hypothetical protein